MLAPELRNFKETRERIIKPEEITELSIKYAYFRKMHGIRKIPIYFCFLTKVFLKIFFFNK